MKPNTVIAQTAFLVGLTPLIPFPFLDEMVRTRLLRRSFRLVAASEGVTLQKASLRWLAADWDGCALGCLFAGLWWPVRKLVKTVFYFMTIKECLDWLAEAGVRAEMVRIASAAGALPDDPKMVREVIVEALNAKAKSPVMNILQRKVPPAIEGTESSLPLRWVYRMVAAGGGPAICEAFSARLAERMGAEE